MNSDGMRKASGSKDSSVVLMHGHRMRSDFDLDSAFVPLLVRSRCVLL